MTNKPDPEILEVADSDSSRREVWRRQYRLASDVGRPEYMLRAPYWVLDAKPSEASAQSTLQEDPNDRGRWTLKTSTDLPFSVAFTAEFQADGAEDAAVKATIALWRLQSTS